VQPLGAYTGIRAAEPAPGRRAGRSRAAGMARAGTMPATVEPATAGRRRAASGVHDALDPKDYFDISEMSK